MTYNVLMGTLSPTHSLTHSARLCCSFGHIAHFTPYTNVDIPRALSTAPMPENCQTLTKEYLKCYVSGAAEALTSTTRTLHREDYLFRRVFHDKARSAQAASAHAINRRSFAIIIATSGRPLSLSALTRGWA